METFFFIETALVNVGTQVVSTLEESLQVFLDRRKGSFFFADLTSPQQFKRVGVAWVVFYYLRCSQFDDLSLVELSYPV